MPTKKQLTGTTWQCLMADSNHFAQTCTVTRGVMDPTLKGENTIDIEYETGQAETIQLRHLLTRYKQLHHVVQPVKPKWQQTTHVQCPYCKAEQTTILDTTTNIVTKTGAFDQLCNTCQCTFTVEFEHRPYIRAFIPVRENQTQS